MNNSNFTVTLFLLTVFLFSLQDTHPEESKDNIILKKIITNGNNKTKFQTIVQILDIDTGIVYDSVSVGKWEDKLLESGLFRFVKIYSVVTKNRGIIIISLKENIYLSISDIGGELFSRKYGLSENWWKARLGISIANFRGKKEHLHLMISFWDSRLFGVSWYKPFISTSNFINLGFQLGRSPSATSPWLNSYLNQFATVGKKLKKNKIIYVNLTTRYNDYEYKGSKGLLKRTPIKDTLITVDSLTGISNKLIKYKNLPASPKLTMAMDYDISWSDTIDIDSDTGAIYTWTGNNSRIIIEREEPYPEVFFNVGWKKSNLKPQFNPRNGICLSFSGMTNIIPHDENHRYLQINNEFIVYHRGLFPKNTIAYRLRPTIRLGSGSINEGISMGGESTLRGFNSSSFGGIKVYNNRLLFSCEYRFLILNIPVLHFPWFARYHSGLNDFSSAITGAIIVDCGYLWKDLLNPIHPGIDHESAASMGLGIRLIAPTIKRSLCFDMMWGLYPEKNNNRGIPVWSLYVDMLF